MEKEHLTKAQRTDLKSITTGIIGGAYVLIADKAGALYGIYTAGKTGGDATAIGAIVSILFSLLVAAVGFHFFKKANKK